VRSLSAVLEGLDVVVDRVIAPAGGPAASLPWGLPFLLGNGGLGIRHTGQAPSGDTTAILSDLLGLFGLSGGICLGVVFG
jgi:hypothetical protein